MHVDATDPLKNQNYAQNLLIEAVDAEKQLWKLFHSKGPLDTDVQESCCKTRSCYENVILNDHEFAELHGIERTLWKLHYKHIVEYRNRIQEISENAECIDSAIPEDISRVPQNSDNLLKGFRTFLSEATEFYQELITKIRASHGLPKEPFIFKGGDVFSSHIESTKIQKCQLSCHRCLVCLGDLARYNELYGNPDVQNRNWSVAATHYLNASILWPDSGNPQNQLAVLATYIGDELLAMYHCVRSLAVKEPFPDAWNNLFLLFENNRAFHLHSFSNEATFNFLKPSERNVVQAEAPRKATDDVFWPGETSLWHLIVRMISSFYIESSLEDFPCIFAFTISELEVLLSLDDAKLETALECYQHMRISAAKTGPFRSLQLVCALIFTIHTLSERPKSQKPQCKEDIKQPILIQLASAASFICMGRLVDRCAVSNPVDHSPLLPAILFFLEWLVNVPDTSEVYFPDEKNASAMGYFFSVLVDLLNKFGDEETGIELMDAIESPNCTALWEDNELRGFTLILLPMSQSDFSMYDSIIKGFEQRDEHHVRVHRILFAAMNLINSSKGNKKWICYDKLKKKFYLAEPKELEVRRELETAEFSFHREAIEVQHLSVSDKFAPPCGAAKEIAILVDEIASISGRVYSQENSIHMEDDEVIVFKPNIRTDSLQLHVPIAASPTSRCHNSPLYGGDYVNCPGYDSAYTHYFAPAYSTPLPSAPLLPDDAISCSGDSSTHTGCNDLVHSGHIIKNLTQQHSMVRKGIPNSVGTSQVDNYFDTSWARTQGLPGFGSGYPLNNQYMEFPTTADAAPWIRQNWNNLNPVQATDLSWPNNFCSQTLLGRFHDLDISGSNTHDRFMNSSPFNMMSYSEGPPLHPGYSHFYGANERRERIFTGYEGAIPHSYAYEMDLRYEQLRLLQYLKEQEWKMQRERDEQRGPFQHEFEPMHVPLARHFQEHDRLFGGSAHITTHQRT